MTAYKTQSGDTDIASEMVVFSIWNSWDEAKKSTSLDYSTKSARTTSRYLVTAHLGNRSETEKVFYFLRKVLNSDYIGLFSVGEQITMTGVFEEIVVVAKILHALGIPHHVGGSVASSIWGEIRYTQDIDIVADIQEGQVRLLLEAFSPRFYISEVAIREAIKLGQSFNLIDNETGWKINIFLLDKDPFQVSRFQRKNRSL